MRKLILILIPLFLFVGCPNFWQGVTNDIVALGNGKVAHKRIAGRQYIDFSRGDDKDAFYAQNGYLCVIHNPGCGWWGNNGTDKFFAGIKALPPGCSIEKVEFVQFWPKEILSVSGGGGIGGWGSYGAQMKSAANSLPCEISWNNACQGVFDGKILYYRISFVISMLEGMDLGEDVYDLSDDKPMECLANGFQDTPVTSLPPTGGTVLEKSGFSGVVKYCNITPTTATGTLRIEAKLLTPATGAQGSDAMTENIPVSFDPSGGGAPSSAGFKTSMTYKQGKWQITQAKIAGLTNNLPGLPLTVDLTGGAGTPMLDFTSGLPCNR